MSKADLTTSASNASPEDDWTDVTDPNERRKIQNRIAQRKFRMSRDAVRILQEEVTDRLAGDKVRSRREESERSAENERRASAAYVAPEADELDASEPSGLPWGSISLRHVVATGRAREQSSRETSVYADASKTGGSSR
jgi:hypothetical protein